MWKFTLRNINPKVIKLLEEKLNIFICFLIYLFNLSFGDCFAIMKEKKDVKDELYSENGVNGKLHNMCVSILFISVVSVIPHNILNM